MFFCSKIEIDPSQITEIKYTGNAGLFSQFLNAIKGSEKVEKETFSAMAILEKLYNGLTELGLTNVIRLAIDDFDYFFDSESNKDDLKDAMVAVKQHLDPTSSNLFSNIFLVVEESREGIKYIIEFRIQRTHKVGEYPIKIHVNALFDDLKINVNDEQEKEINLLKQKLSTIFESNESYNSYINGKFVAYERFVKNLFFQLGKFIEVDAIKHITDKRLIRPSKLIENPSEVEFHSKSFSIFYGYPETTEYIFYAWLWCQYCYENSINLRNVKLVDSHGYKILNISDIGISANDYMAFCLKSEFIPLSSPFVKYYSNNMFNHTLVKVSKNLFDVSNDNFGESYDWLNKSVDNPNLTLQNLRTRRDY